MATKISIIGAGSANFALDLLRDICLTPNLQGCTISFMDIDEDRLQGTYQLCRRYADELGLRIALEMTTDRLASLRGADVVICVALAAGHDRLREGWDIALRHGYRFGGSFHIVHDEAFWVNFYQLELIESIQCDILDVCPDAWFVLISNPVMAAVTYLTRKYPQAKVVGLCNGSSMVYKIVEAMGLDRAKVNLEMAGINHFVWLTQFRYNGQDAFPLLDRWIDESFPAYIVKMPKSNGIISAKSIDLYRRFGALPLGDTFCPGGGSWPYWYHTSDEVDESWYEHPIQNFYAYFERGMQGVARIKRLVANTAERVVDQYPLRPSGDFIVQVLESLICDIPRIYMTNIANKGSFVPGIPEDFQVEVPALVSKRGIQGIRTNGLPKPLIAYALRDRVASVETELEAFARGDRNLLLNVILMDPFTTSMAQAQRLLDEILALPCHERLRQHYR